MMAFGFLGALAGFLLAFVMWCVGLGPDQALGWHLLQALRASTKWWAGWTVAVGAVGAVIGFFLGD